MTLINRDAIAAGDWLERLKIAAADRAEDRVVREPGALGDLAR